MINIGNTPVAATLYWAWNRLEARPRKKQFEQVLQARIHDPLWMLGRQWQMGEFKGNDTGSGILSKLQMDYTKMSFVGPHNGTPVAYNQDMPLEPLVERIRYKWSIKERILLAKKWEYFMQLNNVQNTLSDLFPGSSNAFLIETNPPQNTDLEQVIISKSEVFSDKRINSFFAGINLINTKMDGGAIYELLKKSTWEPDLQAISGISFSLTGLGTSRGQFINWVESMYNVPQGDENWNKSSMDYEFDAYWPKDVNATQLWKLSANKYHQGSFDWYAFDQEYNPNPATSSPNKKSIQVMMSEARFSGMPSSRWWEFENGGVNFCQIDGNTTDIAKIVLTQFALLYQDDWFVIPYKVPVGSYASVKGIVVTDVFGVTTFVANNTITNYNINSGFSQDASDWKHWRWMDIWVNSGSASAINSQAPSGSLLIPPVMNKTLKGKNIESVLFMRDEMSNMVWGIEKTVPDLLGKGKDGYVKANDFISYLKKIKPALPPLSIPDENAKLKYELVTTEVPENWIPLIPAHKGNVTGVLPLTAITNRAMALQRASLPRIIDSYNTTLIRPRTEVLRYGLADTPIKPLFINEEEVPRGGAIVETSFKRTRWYNGKVVLWVGRTKKTGKGEGASNLLYDKVTPVENT